MKRTLLIAALVVFAPFRATAQSTCKASDANALRLRGYVRDLVSTSDPEKVQVRNSFGLKATDSTTVVLVADNAKCNKAAQGINTALGTTGMVRQLYLLAVGQIFAAQDPGHPSGEWWPTHTLDEKYKLVGVVLAP